LTRPRRGDKLSTNPEVLAMSILNPTRPRGSIIAVFALIGLGAISPSESAQFRPQPATPISPPNGMLGQQGGTFPASGAGAQGGITGNGNFAGRPPATTIPTIPQPPTNFPTVPSFERVWSCEKCRKEVGRGNFPPSTCQHCGVRLINGSGSGDKPTGSGGTMTPGMGNTPIGMVPPPGMNPGQPYTPEPTPNYPPQTYTPNYNSGSTTPAPAPATTNSGRSVGAVLIIVAGAITGVLMLIVGIIIAFVIISKNSSKRSPRRVASRRRRNRDDD